MSNLTTEGPLFFLDADLEHLRRQHTTMTTDIEAAGKDMGEANKQSSETCTTTHRWMWRSASSNG